MPVASLHAPTRIPPARSTAVTAIGGGLAVLAVAMLIVRDGRVPAVERSITLAINGLPDWLYPIAWPFQQVGALLVGPLVALVAWITHRRRLVLAAVAVTVLKLIGERIVKALVSRSRPAQLLGSDIEVRGDVPLTGESFVSGHAVLVTALAVVVTPYLQGRARLVPWVLVAGVLLGRVYVGAHHALDVVGGAALGLAIGAAVDLLTRRPSTEAAAP